MAEFDCLASLLSRFPPRYHPRFIGACAEPLAVPMAPEQTAYHLVLSGALRLDQRQTVLAPAVIVLPRGRDHHLFAAASPAPDIIAGILDFGGADLNPLLTALPDTAVLDLDKSHQPVLALAEQEYRQPGHGSAAILTRLAEIVLVEVFRNLIDKRLMNSGILAGLADPRLARAIAAIHAEPGRDWTLASLAAEAGLSRTAFAMGFSHQVGIPAGAYLAWWRVALARDMLEHGQSLKDTAQRVGYGSAAALARQIRAQLGQGPRDIRRDAKI